MARILYLLLAVLFASVIVIAWDIQPGISIIAIFATASFLRSFAETFPSYHQWMDRRFDK